MDHGRSRGGAATQRELAAADACLCLLLRVRVRVRAWQVAILLNLGGSFVLYRRIKKDMSDDLEHGSGKQACAPP